MITMNELVLVQPFKDGGLKYRVISKQTGKEVYTADIQFMRKNTLIRVTMIHSPFHMQILSNQDRNEYLIFDEQGIPFGKIKFIGKLHEPMVVIETNKGMFKGKGNTMGESFDIKDGGGGVVLSIQKTLVALEDTFKIVHNNYFDARLAIATAMCIDDKFFR